MEEYAPPTNHISLLLKPLKIYPTWLAKPWNSPPIINGEKLLTFSNMDKINGVLHIPYYLNITISTQIIHAHGCMNGKKCFIIKILWNQLIRWRLSSLFLVLETINYNGMGNQMLKRIKKKKYNSKRKHLILLREDLLKGVVYTPTLWAQARLHTLNKTANLLDIFIVVWSLSF